jgi:hypothetical protein
MRGQSRLRVALVGLVFAAACGGSTTGDGSSGSGGAGSGSLAGTGSLGSAGSRSGISSGSTASGNPDSSGRGGGGSPRTAVDDCPNCPGSQVCCLTPNGTQLQGTCAATVAACPTGAASVPCQSNGDCNGAEVCCVTGGGANAPSSTRCTTSCTGQIACGDSTDCPNNGTGWNCVLLPGTPEAVFGVCAEVAGQPDSGNPSTPDAGASPDSSGVPDGSGAPDSSSAPDGTEGGTVQDATAGG